MKRKLLRSIAAFYGVPWAVDLPKLEAIDGAFYALISGDKTPKAGLFDDDDGDENPSGVYRTQFLDGGIALMSLSGTISHRANLFSNFSGGTSTQMFGQAFDQVMANPDVRAVIFDVDSPGGSVDGVAELSDKIFAARGTKPVVAVSNTLMASAAYWIASAADKVVASPSSNTGSIGVYTVHRDFSAAREKSGETRTVFRAGRYKALHEMSIDDESQARIQARIDGTYALFIGDVARNRGPGVTAQNVKNGYGEGTTELAADAVTTNLADEVATLEAVVERMVSKFGKPSSASSPGVTFQGGRAQARDAMNLRLKAALVAKGAIAADASDDVAAAAFQGICFAKGVTAPEDVDQALSLIFPAAAAADPKPAGLTEEDITKATQKAQGVERKRVADIKAKGKLLNVPADKVEEIIESGATVEEATMQLTEVLGTLQKSHVRPDFIGFGPQAVEKFAEQASEGLEFRTQLAAGQKPDSSKLTKEGAVFSGMRFSRIAEESLQVLGVNTRGMSPIAIAKLALNSDNQSAIMAAGGQAFYTTGSFANLSLNALRKTLMKGYDEAPTTFQVWCREGETFLDMKIQNVIKMSGAGDAEETPEGEDYPVESGMTDDREFFVGAAFGKIVRLSWQAIVNDDLRALSRLPAMQGTAMKRTWNKAAYRILTGNPTMADGVTLFHASSHGANLLGSGAAPSTAQLQAMQVVMAKQSGLHADQNALNIPLKYIVAPVALGNTAKQLSRSITDPASSNANVPNVWQGFEVVLDAQLDLNSAVAYYGLADNAVIDTVEIRFLEGQQTPMVDSEYDFDSDARKFKIVQVGAVFPVDYRGMVKNPGQ